MTPSITLEPVTQQDMPAFKQRLQDAFTQAAREAFPDFPEVIPPERETRQMRRERERQALAVERRELTEEQRERLSAEVASLERGDEIEVTHFDGGHYEVCRGAFGGIDEGLGAIVVDGRRVEMADVVAIARVAR